MDIAWWIGQIYVLKNISLQRKNNGPLYGSLEVIICLHRVTSKRVYLSGLYISQYMHWLLRGSFGKYVALSFFSETN